MTRTPPITDDEATTFYLDARRTASSGPSALRHPGMQRFMSLCFGGLLLTGSATALLYGAESVVWWIVLLTGAGLLAGALWLWARRPFVRATADGLTFRARPLADRRTVPWHRITRLDPEMTAVRLHRNEAPPFRLSLDALPADDALRLALHLAETARQHGVSVS